MTDKEAMDNRKKSTIILVVAICVIATALAVIAVQTVLSSGTNHEISGETERIGADEGDLQDQTESGDAQVPVETATPAEGGDSGTIDVENNNIITSEKAREVALKDAGLKESQVTMSRIKYEWEDGIQIYDVEFYSGGQEYEYEIDAQSGRILGREIDD